MPEIIVVTGPPGSGKSSVAEALVDAFDPGALVTGDDFFAVLRRGAVAPWLPAAHEQNELVTRAAAAATRYLSQRCTVIYDGVVGPWFLPAFTATTGADRLHYAVLLPPEQTCLDRVARRRGHGFTDLDAAQHMYRDFAHADVGDRHVVTTVDDDPAVIAAEVLARVRDGSLGWPG